jgi:hypothetical protein
MTAFQGAVDATFAAFGIDTVYTPTGGEPVSVRVIARRPDTIVAFGETRIHARDGHVRAARERGCQPAARRSARRRWQTFVIQGEPERRDSDRLVWSLDVKAA